MIHKTAIISPKAQIDLNVTIDPYAVIGENVEIGSGTIIGPHAVINGPTKIGRDNHIFQFTSIGENPQDLKFRGEKTYLEIGDRNIIREFCTINRGTAQDKGLTKIGNDNLLMAYVHIAHDCSVGNHTIFANNASLAGHVQVDDYAILSGFSGVYQFCRMGMYSFASTNAVIIKDVPPFVKVSGYYAKPFGLNTVGLQRHGFTSKMLREIKQAYRIIYRNGLSISDAIIELQKIDSPYAKQMHEFLTAKSNGGIVR